MRFAYRPGEPVLRGMSFVAEPGKVTALVGPSGGGKSTVLNLMLRFYEPRAARSSIDGQNIATCRARFAAPADRLRRPGRVPVPRHDPRQHRDRQAGRDAKTRSSPPRRPRTRTNSSSAFPDGYDTPVGEHGAKLSGGERQRVAIARALIKNAPIILLDEATASLDSESERLVQEAMAHLCEGRTTMVIAHRLHTIMHADRILVVENGVIVESGRHDELLRKGGRYASFYRLQLREQGADAPIPIASSA